MRLAELQRRMAADLIQPLDSWRINRDSFRSATDYIQPNRRLKAGDRLEIYSRSYWFRIFDAFYEDFPALRAVLGEYRFRALTRAYLADCPSRSFTLRNLGSRLVEWLETHQDLLVPHAALGLDLAKLEWAEIEAFDGEEGKPLDKLPAANSRLRLQPHLSLLAVGHDVDDLRIAVNNGADHYALRRFLRAWPKPVHLAVYRYKLSVYYRRLEPDEFLLLDRLHRGRTLAQALRGLEDRPDDVRRWLANAAELGWFCQ